MPYVNKRRTSSSIRPTAVAVLLGMASMLQLAAFAQTAHSADVVPASAVCAVNETLPADPALAEAQKIVNHAAGVNSTWDGPKTSFSTQKGVRVVYIASNANNPGDIGVYDGLKEAATALGWDVKMIDGQNSPSTNLDALSQGIALSPKAIVVSSYEPKSAGQLFDEAKAAGIIVIGNHTGEASGFQPKYPGLFTNISSDPAEIAKVAASCALVASKGTAEVSLVGCGGQFALCRIKEDAMANVIKQSWKAKVLAINNFPFEEIQQRMGAVAVADYQKFGSKLTYMLSINDLYWDVAIPALSAVGVEPDATPYMIAAGDGSPAAFDRIRKHEHQIATVAEPLQFHGWQIADEIVRALNGKEPSNFVSYPHLVTAQNVDLEGGDKGIYDPSNNYRDEYRKMWAR